jgi:hypothetical protein
MQQCHCKVTENQLQAREKIVSKDIISIVYQNSESIKEKKNHTIMEHSEMTSQEMYMAT